MRLRRVIAAYVLTMGADRPAPHHYRANRNGRVPPLRHPSHRRIRDAQERPAHRPWRRSAFGLPRFDRVGLGVREHGWREHGRHDKSGPRGAPYLLDLARMRDRVRPCRPFPQSPSSERASPASPPRAVSMMPACRSSCSRKAAASAGEWRHGASMRWPSTMARSSSPPGARTSGPYAARWLDAGVIAQWTTKASGGAEGAHRSALRRDAGHDRAGTGAGGGPDHRDRSHGEPDRAIERRWTLAHS